MRSSSRPHLRILIPLLALGLSACGPPHPDPIAWSLDELLIEVADTSREVSFTNKRAGFLYTESNSRHTSAWQGWHVSSVKLLSDIRVLSGGKPLDRSRVDYARVWPHQMTRSYRDGPQETIVLLDSLDAVLVLLENLRGETAEVMPLFDRSHQGDTAVRPEMLVVSPFPRAFRSSRPDVPGWVAVAAFGPEPEVSVASTDVGSYRSIGSLRSGSPGGKAGFVLAAGATPDAAVATAKFVLTNAGRLRDTRAVRMTTLLNQSLLRSSDRRFDKAVAWAKLSLDALIMEQGRKGIFAGLPWFSNYWGRDTFISLAGATLVTGSYRDAREILESFAAWQNRDERSRDEGRIPNIVTPTSTAYNTADATPWFALALYEYMQSSGDTAFVREQFPVLRRAIEGALRHRVDRYGFLTHGDAETWMDAVGPEGPWSPRGDRANDIQALWHRQLLVSTAIAERLGEQSLAERWDTWAERLARSFQDAFVDPSRGMIADHLRPDGSRDSSVRPNQLFALGIVADPSVRERVFHSITEQLVYPHGVASLSQHDDRFHPYHQYAPYYPKDAAYHNGIVWTWLNGPWIASAVDFGQQDLAWRLTSRMTNEILDKGAVGTLAELVDAAPRTGGTEPRLSGTFSQAWSLAEYIRTIYRSYLGISIDAPHGQVWLMPRFPSGFEGATADVVVGDRTLRVSISGDGTKGHVRLSSLHGDGTLSVNIGWPFENKRGRTCNVSLPAGRTIDIVLTEDAATAELDDGSEVSIDTQVQFLREFPNLHNLTLAEPRVRQGLASLRGPGHPLIPHAVIAHDPEGLRTLFEAADPEGDDRGTGSYVYPETPHLLPGSLDITRLRISAADTLVRFELTFRALSDPGWHPEYGFQLTFAAIAIDTDGKDGSGGRTIGRNANATVRRGREFERIIYVGGGVRVEDAGGTVLAEYLPAPEDVRSPIGSVRDRTVRFTLPARLLGEPSDRWRVSVYAGAQDDRGGAGLGDFRAVAAKAGEWVGGGRRSDRDPNIYDILEYPN